MNFKQIEVFANVIKHKSFSKAADATFLTQPTISSHISTLEKELGLRLVDRRGREALPTEQGKILYKFAIDMLKLREKAIFSLENYSKDIGGVLEIHASSVPGKYIVPDLMSCFIGKYPNVKFYLEQSDSGTVEESLLSKKSEIGFLGYKGSLNLEYKKVLTDSAVIITPDNEKFRPFIGEALPVELFLTEPFVWREEGSATRKEFEGAIRKLGYNVNRLNIIARMNSMEAIKQAVSSGLGVSILSGIAADSKPYNKGYLSFPIKGMEMDRDFYLAWHKDGNLSPIAETFKNFVKEAL